MAELVDALGSGPSGSNVVQVRVLFWASWSVNFDTRLAVFYFIIAKEIKGLLFCWNLVDILFEKRFSLFLAFLGLSNATP